MTTKTIANLEKELRQNENKNMGKQ